MSVDLSLPTEAIEAAEAYKTLFARVGRKSPIIPADALVRHVLAIIPATEWPVRLEAMDALLRRLDSAKTDGLRIASRPAGKQVLGLYTTRRKASQTRPYQTTIAGLSPLDCRCNCPDFVKNALGVCKHVFAIVADLYSKPRSLEKALDEQEKLGSTSGLTWDPIRPLTGAGDWLDRVVWQPRSPSEPKPPFLKRFRLGPEGKWGLKDSFLEQAGKRRDLVSELLEALPEAQTTPRADPALRALLVGEEARMKRVAEHGVGKSELKGSIKKLKRELYPYQREGIERFLEVGRLLLADDMGLGKTAQAISSCHVLWHTGRVRRGLIIAPAALKPQWAREWAQFTDIPITIIEGTPSERLAVYQSAKEGLFIISYEQLIRDLETIRRWGPDLVVLDEAQRIKNWATKTALSVKGLVPTYRLVLTGTPMENRIEELASVVEWVDDMALEPKWRLNALHAIRADGKREVTGVRHLETLRARLKPCMVRRVRQEVLSQLPPRTDIRVPVELTERQREEHDALIQPILSLMQKSQKRPLSQPEFLRLMSLLTTQRIISNGLAQLEFNEVWPEVSKKAPDDAVLTGLSSPKLAELRQLVRQIVLEQGRKIVIFSQWRRMLTLAHWSVSDLLASGNLRAGYFTGAEGQKRRTQNIVEFHDDPNLRLLFASDAGGVGLNLQRAANCVINLELPWNPAVLEQRIGRIYRIGQDRPIDVYNLVCEQGIESRIASLVGSKQAFFKNLFDGESDAVQFEQSGSFMSRIEKLYELSKPLDDNLPDDIMLADEEDEPSLDDEILDPYETLVESGDESQDGLVRAEPALAMASEKPDYSVQPEPSAPAAGDVATLFSQLQIRKAPGGKVVIEASEEVASTLTALFQGMAALLQGISRPPE